MMPSINNIIGGANMKEIYFIRHGQTEWNKMGKSQGREADTDLNQTGVEQAIQTGKYLKKYRLGENDFDCILSSPMKRCKQTTENICSNIDYDESNVIYMDELAEIKQGTFSGTTGDNELGIKYNKLIKSGLSIYKDPIEKYLMSIEESFYDTIIKDNSLPIEGLELYFDETLPKLRHIIDYLKSTDNIKILIISHSALLELLLKEIFNLCKLPSGDTTNGKNCSICYCTIKHNEFTGNNEFNMITPQNTQHLSLDVE